MRRTPLWLTGIPSCCHSRQSGSYALERRPRRLDEGNLDDARDMTSLGAMLKSRCHTGWGSWYRPPTVETAGRVIQARRAVGYFALKGRKAFRELSATYLCRRPSGGVYSAQLTTAARALL